MTVFNTYSTGTAGVVNGSTTITGAGTLWSGINVRPGDDIELDGHTVVILDVVDTTHLTISPWPYASVPVSASPASPYKIIWRSPLRYAGGQAMADVDLLIASLSNPIFSGTVTAPTIAGGSLAASTLVLESTSGAGTTDAIIFKTGSQVEAARFDTSGRLNIGGATNTVIDGYNSKVQVFQTINAWNMTFVKNKADNEGALIALVKSRNATAGGNTVVQSGDQLGLINFYGADGTNFLVGATIKATIDAAPGANDMPTRLAFMTTPDGASFATERLRIDNAGNIITGSSASIAGLFAASPLLQINTGTPNNIFGGIAIQQWQNSAGGSADIYLSHSRGTTIGSYTIVQNGDTLAYIAFGGSDGTNFEEAAAIAAYVDGTPGNNDMPGRLLFRTTPDGSNASLERLRIDNKGNVIINTAAIATNATDGFLYVPTCAGTPTGVPTTYTGRAAVIVDTTNNRIYFYSTGAWRNAGP